MYLEALRVKRFRNIADLEWEPFRGLNLIHGDNGRGKTNLLEAIHMGLLGRSFRTQRDEDCLPWREKREKEEAEEIGTRIDLTLLRRVGNRRLRLTLGRGWKRAYADDVLLERLGDLWNGAAVVAFTPADVDLFRDAPARRRRFLDLALCQGSRIYLEELQRYGKALREANALLKRGRDANQSRSEAAAYYSILARSGAALMRARSECLQALFAPCADLYASLGGSDPLELGYEPSLKGAGFETDDADRLAVAIEARLTEAHAESVRLGMVALGPHRDDLTARLAHRDLGRYGSQGQHRLAALALKLASAFELERGLGDPPILLLDDFGSELDVARRTAVLAAVRGRMQTFITATDAETLGGKTAVDEMREMGEGGWR